MHNLRIKVIFVVSMIASVFALFPMIITAVAPTFSNSYPANGATDVELTPTLRTTVNDPEGDTMNITFRTNATGTWGDIGSNNSVYNGTYYQTNSSMNSYSTKYWWSVNCTDGNSWTNETYYFTTRDPTVSISVNQSSYVFTGTKALNTVYYTNETNPNYFGITNNGEVAVDLKISATTMTCSYSHSWTLSTSNGPNQYVLEYSEDGSTWDHIGLTETTFYTDLGASDSITLDLRLTMPTSVDCGHVMGCTVSISAVQH
jgi:hypothetical protein